MHLVSDVMSHNIIFVTRDATIRTAVELLRLHQIDVVPVVHDGQIIGLLDPLRLCLYDGEVSVAEAAGDPPVTVEPDTPLPEAGMRMRQAKLRQVPVVQAGKLVGMLSERDLLSVWGIVNDPLTGLPVQFQFRRWLSLNLYSGREVTILFLDLDNFGQLNKSRGHVHGDQILRAVADVLREAVDPEQDFLCRYGGDEFAIGTTRRIASARDLATKVRDRVAQVQAEGQPAGVTVAVGLSGGRRIQARPEAHIDATLDDLITRASTASTAAKQVSDHIAAFESASADAVASQPARHDPDGMPPRLVLEGYHIGQSGQEIEVIVGLRSGPDRHEGRCVATETDVTRALVTATARCLETFARDPVGIKVEETYEYTTPHGVACVGATVTLARGTDQPECLVGASPIHGDRYRTYVHAVLDATNRRLIRREVLDPDLAARSSAPA